MQHCTQQAIEDREPSPERVGRSTLPRVDYADHFVFHTPTAGRTAEGWARTVLEGAGTATKAQLLAGWSSLGLQLDLKDPGAVLGWLVAHRTDDAVLLKAGSRIGLPGELLFTTTEDALHLSTFVQHRNAAARALWTKVIPVHRQTVRRVLEAAAAAQPPTK